MSLPWFAFDADAFTGDTAHLTTEETGAYLLLMLAYYRSEKPLPARDRALAAIVKLPMDRWLEAKISLSEFFIEQDGTWRHDRIEAEITERAKRHEETVRRGKAGAELRWGKGKARSTTRPSHSPANSQANSPANGSAIANSKAELGGNVVDIAKLKPDHSHTNSPAIATAIPNSRTYSPTIAGPLVGLKQTDAQEQEHINSLSARAREGDQAVQGKVKEEPFSDDEGIGTPIDPAFWPSDNRLAVCKFDGASEDEIKREVSGFIDHKLGSGSFSNDWDASWGIWWKRWQERRNKEAAKQAKKEPRQKPSPATPAASTALSVTDGPYIPTAAELDRTIPMWMTGVRWPRAFGPEPGMPGCRVPKSILEKHGIDPKTGMKVSTPKPEAVKA